MERKIIAILRGIKPSEAIEITNEIVNAGISRIEVPLNSPDAFASIAAMSREFGSRTQVGAGTVLRAEDVKTLKAVGGQFVVSPNCDLAVIEATKRANLASYPGVFTASECFSAASAGADGLKFFPASVLGPAGLKALKAVLPGDMDCYAVGGVGPDNFAQWRSAGADGFGIGSALFSPGDDVKSVQATARMIVDSYDKAFQHAV